MRSTRAASLATLVIGLAGCGVPTYIVVTIDSDLTIPSQVDALDLRILDGDDTRLLAEERFDLGPGISFPIDVSFEPEEKYLEDAQDAGTEIHIRATAFLDQDVVATADGYTDWKAGKTTNVPPLTLVAVP